MAGRRAMRPVGMRGLAAAARTSPAVSFLLAAVAAAALVGGACFWVVVASFRLPEPGAQGCLPTARAPGPSGCTTGGAPSSSAPSSWKGGAAPTARRGRWPTRWSSANSSAWPVANPVLTCASATWRLTFYVCSHRRMAALPKEHGGAPIGGWCCSGGTAMELPRAGGGIVEGPRWCSCRSVAVLQWVGAGAPMVLSGAPVFFGYFYDGGGICYILGFFLLFLYKLFAARTPAISPAT